VKYKKKFKEIQIVTQPKPEQYDALLFQRQKKKKKIIQNNIYNKMS